VSGNASIPKLTASDPDIDAISSNSRPFRLSLCSERRETGTEELQ
jgi:hypothetical protein